jgi:CHAD domain-containing protein
MHNFREAALDWSDPEGVHSMRVASRRLRGAMRDFMPYMRQRGLTPVLKRTKSVAAALGEVRDQDVAIIALEKIQKDAPDAMSAALQQLIDERKEQRNESREKLSSILIASEMKEAKTEFMSRIEKATAVRKASGPSGSGPTYSKMAATVIVERLQELEKLSESLYQPFEVDALHDMRIGAKRLRYAMELFQQCWGRTLQPFAKNAARLQTALGELHDCDDWIESLGKRVSQARNQKKNDHVAAFIWLLSHFVKIRTKHLRQAYDLWGEWEATDVGGRVRQALQ